MGNVFCACVGNGDDSNRPRRLVRTVRSDISGVGDGTVLVDAGAVVKQSQGEPEAVLEAGASSVSSATPSAVDTHKSAFPRKVWQKYIETGKEPRHFSPERNAFERLRLIKEQKKEVESLPLRNIYGLRSRNNVNCAANGSNSSSTYTIRLQTGLSSDMDQVHDVIIDPEVLTRRNFSIPEHAALYNSNTAQSPTSITNTQQRLLVKDLKEEIAKQICGNTKVFEIWYYVAKEENEEEEEADDGSDVGGEFVMLKNMEQLVVSVGDDGGDEHDDGALRSSERRSSRNNQLRIFFYGDLQEWWTMNNGCIPDYVMKFARDECQIFMNRDGAFDLTISHVRDSIVPDHVRDGNFDPANRPMLFEFRKCEKIFTGQCTGSSWCEEGDPDGRPTSMLVKLNSSSELFHGDLERIQKEVNVDREYPNKELLREAYRDRTIVVPSNIVTKERVYPKRVDEVRRILLESPTKQMYIFVEREIFAFSLPDDEIGEIEWLHSRVGRALVPYTVAVGKKYLYFLGHQIYVPREAIQEETWLYEDVYEGDESRFEDAYSWFYGHDREYEDENDIPMNRWQNNKLPNYIVLCIYH